MAYRPLRTYAILAALVVGIAALSLWGAYHLLASNQTETVQRFSDRNVELARKTLLSLVERAGEDALFLSHLTSLHDYLESPTEANLRHVTADFLAFADHSEDVYYMVRYIDLGGQEEVRILETMPGFSSIPRKGLGNKRDRFYFKDCASLQRELIYVSSLELSSADTLGASLAPSLRFGTPVFDRYGVKRGVILLNYEGRELFGAIGEENPELRGWDLTFFGQGNKRYDNPHESTWWFTYPNELTTVSPYPDQLDSLFRGMESGSVKHHGSIYSVQTIEPLIDGQVVHKFDEAHIPASIAQIGGDRYQWKLVLTAPRYWIIRDVRKQVETIAIVGAIGLGPIFGLLWIIVMRQQRLAHARQLEQEHQKLLTAQRLARTIAHEFRQPLAGLQLVADLTKTPIPPEQKLDFLERVPRFVYRIDELVSKLLSLSSMRTIPYIGGIDILDLKGDEDSDVDKSKTADEESGENNKEKREVV